MRPAADWPYVMRHKQRLLIQVGGCIYDAESYPHSHGFESLDPVGREAFVNHIHISGADREREADGIIEAWRSSMVSDWPGYAFRIYRHAIDDEIIVRFHVVRRGVPNWSEGAEGHIVVNDNVASVA